MIDNWPFSFDGPKTPPVAAEPASADVRTTARFLGISPSLVYAYVERKQIPHYRIGRCIRFSLEEVAKWRQQFHVNGGIE